MEMKLLDRIRKDKGITNYGIAKEINDLGVRVTTQTIETQARNQNLRAMRLDVLCALRKISGLGWAEFGRLLDSEFLRIK